MSNKFLPFVTESSTPLTIWNTILSRSKGMEVSLIVSVFNLVLGYGVKKLRAEAKQLPDVSLEELYVKLVEIHPKYKVDMNLLMEFIRMGEYCGSKLFIDHGNEKDYDSLTAYQILQFLYPLCLYPDKLSDYIGFPIDLAVKERDTYMSNISSYLKFDSNATLISFDTADDFRSWVLYMIVLSNYDSECPWSTSETYRLQFVCR